MEQVENLRASVVQLSADSKEIRAELAASRAETRRRTDAMAQRTRLLAWLFAAGGVILACALLAAYQVSLNNQAALDKSNRQWCPLVSLLIPKPGDAQATTERGKELEENARSLYTSFGCGTAAR